MKHAKRMQTRRRRDEKNKRKRAGQGCEIYANEDTKLGEQASPMYANEEMTETRIMQLAESEVRTVEKYSAEERRRRRRRRRRRKRVNYSTSS